MFCLARLARVSWFALFFPVLVHSVEFSGSGDWTVDLSGTLSGSFFSASCPVSGKALVDQTSLCSRSLTQKVYGLTNDFSPSFLSLRLSQTHPSRTTAGAVLSVQLPVVSSTIKKPMDSADWLTRGVVFFDNPSFGHFEIGRNYSLLGRDLLFYNPLFPPVFHSNPYLDTRYRGGVAGLRPYVMASYETPLMKGLSLTFSLGDSTALLSGLSFAVAQQPNMSFRFLFQKERGRVWFNYFSQKLSFPGNIAKLRLSAQECGAAVGHLKDNGFSFVWDYQSGRALGLLSDIFLRFPTTATFPSVRNLFWGVSYHKDKTRVFANYGKTWIGFPEQEQDSWTLSLSREIYSSLFLTGKISFLNEKVSSSRRQTGIVGFGFLFVF